MENAKNKTFENKNVKSKSGEFTAHINKDINKKLDDYCYAKSVNKTSYVCEAVRIKLEQDFSNLTKEELLKIVLKK